MMKKNLLKQKIKKKTYKTKKKFIFKVLNKTQEFVCVCEKEI